MHMSAKAALGIRLVALLVVGSGCELERPAAAGGGPASTPREAPAPKLPPPSEPTYVGEGTAAGLRYIEAVYGARRDARLPMVVSLHGMGDRPRKPFDQFAPAARFILLRAPDPYGDGFAWMPFQFGEGDDPDGAMARAILRATRMVEAAVAELRARRPTHGKPIFTGVSQGGMLAFAMALYAPERVRVAVPLAGALPPTLWPTGRPAASLRAPPIVALHGGADETVPIEPAARLVEHLQGLGYRARLRRFPGVGHGLSEAMHRARYRTVAGALLETAQASGVHR